MEVKPVSNDSEKKVNNDQNKDERSKKEVILKESSKEVITKHNEKGTECLIISGDVNYII
jgi:hypothetical protein